MPAKPLSLALPRGMRIFTIIWFGQLISTLGSGLSGFSLGVRVYDASRSTTLFAVSLLVYILPTILMAPLAGVLADRWDRRRVMILSDSLAGVATLGVFLVVLSGELQIWQIYIAQFLLSTANTFQWPAYAAATSQLVPKEHLGRAAGMSQVGEAISSLISPAVAGVLYVTAGLKLILSIDILTYFFALATLLLVRFPKPMTTEEGSMGQGGFWKEAIYGWHYIRQRPGLLHLQLVWAAINFTASVSIALFTPMILEITTPDVLGYITSIASAGFLLGTLVLSAWGGPQRKIFGTYAFETLIGLSFVITGLSASIPLVTAGYLLGLFAMPITNGCTQAIWLRKVAQDVQGRVFAVRRMIAFSMIPLAYLASGPLSEKVFIPLLVEGGPLADSLGRIFGTGPGRGIGLMYSFCGLLYMLIALIVIIDPRIRRMELELPDPVARAQENGLTVSDPA